jgi:hypothetical protein
MGNTASESTQWQDITLIQITIVVEKVVSEFEETRSTFVVAEAEPGLRRGFLWRCTVFAE